MSRRERPAERRVVVTGMGLVTPVGNDVPSSWQALLAGKSGGALISHFEATDDFPTRVAAEVKGFDPTLYMDSKEARRFDRYSQLGIAAADQAMHDAGRTKPLTDVQPERFGVVFGSGIGGISTLEENARILAAKGPKRVSPFFIPMFIPDIAAGLISIRFGAQGPNYATVSACASSAHAIGSALRYIQRGDADVMIAGGSEATITPLTVAGFASMKAMTTRNDDPERASRPFDAYRDGFLIGEGAGALVLESLEHAQARDAAIHGEIVGYGLSGDAYHITSPAPEGAGAQHAMRLALEDAGGSAGRGRLHQRTRHVDADERHQRNRRDQGCAGRVCLPLRSWLDEVHDRSSVGRRRRSRGRCHDVGVPGGKYSTHYQLQRGRSHVRPGLRPRRDAGTAGAARLDQLLRIRRAQRMSRHPAVGGGVTASLICASA